MVSASRRPKTCTLAEVAHLSLHRRALGCAMVIRAARLAAISAMAGRPEQAHKAVARLRQLNPPLRVSPLKDVPGRATAAPARKALFQETLPARSPTSGDLHPHARSVR